MIKILVIDDKKEDRDLVIGAIRNALGPVEHEIIEAEDGFPGLKLYGQAKASGKPFDLVITDCHMHFPGDEVMKEIHKGDSQIPVVMVNRSDSAIFELIKSTFESHGATAFLNKLDFRHNNVPEELLIILDDLAQKHEGKPILGKATGQIENIIVVGAGERSNWVANEIKANSREIFQYTKPINASNAVEYAAEDNILYCLAIFVLPEIESKSDPGTYVHNTIREMQKSNPKIKILVIAEDWEPRAPFEDCGTKVLGIGQINRLKSIVNSLLSSQAGGTQTREEPGQKPYMAAFRRHTDLLGSPIPRRQHYNGPKITRITPSM